MNKRTKIVIGIGAIAVALAAFLLLPPLREFSRRAFVTLSTIDPSAVKDYILSFGAWAPAVSFALMVFQSVIAPLPAFLITFANAALFGWAWGALLSWTSAMAGAALCFVIARFYGRGVVSKLTSISALESIDKFFGRHGKYAILIARLLPFISFDIVSYAAGLTPMAFLGFFVATGIGQLPATLVYSYAGAMLTGGAKTFVYGLFIVFPLSALAILIRKIYTERVDAKKVEAKEPEAI
jgi:uncharacterized membrane protein YdjX (TVP38/TMEM64 family)